jgi:hypothetical protein
MRLDPQQVAARSGLDQPTIRRLQERGYLRRLALTEPEMRARLYHAHLAHLRSQAAGRTSLRRQRPQSFSAQERAYDIHVV